MKSTIVPLIGDLNENLYQLGMREKNAFLVIENRIKNLLGDNPLIRQSIELLSRARILLKKREESFFDQCLSSYCQGLGIDLSRYQSLLSLFELSAHYGHHYPKLKGILPGCTSVCLKKDGNISHLRMMDFPLVGIFEEFAKVYYWQTSERPTLLTYGLEGLAPLFFQGIHGSGVSFALHHKPGTTLYKEGEGIFQILFESFFEGNQFGEIKKNFKKKNSISKWSVILVEQSGLVQEFDIEGLSLQGESYDLNENSPLIFTNIPLKLESEDFKNFCRFSRDRQLSAKEKLKHPHSGSLLDLMTKVDGQREKNWIHPCATLSTIAAWEVHLTQGFVDIKEGESALTSSDAITRINLASHNDIKVLKKSSPLTPTEKAWKRAARAQSAYDQGDYETAYHELQIALTLMPQEVWKNIFHFYLFVWDFKFINNSKELSLVYKKLKSLKVPDILKDQWIFMMMRFEKKLNLSSTVNESDLSSPLRASFNLEKMANKAVFATWMKLLYPRMEILDVVSVPVK